jgi:xylan 1,4-beta-xylosidase
MSPSSTPDIRIRVDAGRCTGTWEPIWAWFGYDEPNYTYMPYGKRLLRQLAELHEAPVHVRVHNLLTSGDGTPALKWGSTNAYTETADGEPIYSWEILDRIFDAHVEAGLTPFVQVGFMPEALSSGPSPYRHEFPLSEITAGWAYPPKDYDRWAALVEAFARHLLCRYGEPVRTWPWEVWNEPDGLYWCGSIEEFCRLFDTTAAAIRQVLPEARIGGPHTCGPGSSARAAEFLRRFLQHCAEDPLAARLDFIAFHAKGKPVLVDGAVRMGLARQLGDIAAGLEIVRSFPQFGGLPVILGESDPEGCAACPASSRPENAYRDGALYGAYLVEQIARTQELAAHHGVLIEGAVTWAFEFEGEALFAGYRELATNGIAKPVLNALRMLGMLHRDRLAATSSGALPLARVLAEGVRGTPDIDVVATRRGDDLAILLWHYHDDQAPGQPSARVRIDIAGLGSQGAFGCRHYRMDGDTSNAHTLWLRHGSPATLSDAQRAALEAAGELQTVPGPDRVEASRGLVQLAVELPRHAVSLIVLERASAPPR